MIRKLLNTTFFIAHSSLNHVTTPSKHSPRIASPYVLLSTDPNLPPATNSPMFSTVHEFIVPTNRFGVCKSSRDRTLTKTLCLFFVSTLRLFLLPTFLFPHFLFSLPYPQHYIFVILLVSCKFTCLTIPKLLCYCLLVCILSLIKLFKPTKVR